MRKANRKDNNHKALVDILHQLKVPFVDLSSVGGGIPDGLAFVRGKWEWIEFKNREWGYGRKGLNENQRAWLERYPCAWVYVIENTDDALNLASGKLEMLKSARG